jgi:hypothetical protein
VSACERPAVSVDITSRLLRYLRKDRAKMGLTTKWNCFDIAAQAVNAKERCMVCTKRAAGRML